MATMWDVDDWVENAASLPIKRFYPTAVARATDLPLTVVFERLLYLAEGRKIHLIYEIRCPEYECGRVVKTISDLSEDLVCQTCSIHGEFEISSELIFPVFQFDQDYRNRAKQKKKNKNQNRLVLKPMLV